MRDIKGARALNQEERREKASCAKDCVCRSPEASEVGTDRAQEDEKHAGKAEDGSRGESASKAWVQTRCSALVWEKQAGAAL